jgi:1D-myo-inositol-tetrakisphosphate 5-kinase/inositol-polyphosphate multikinase
MELFDHEVGQKLLSRAMSRAKKYFRTFEMEKLMQMERQVGGHPMLSYQCKYVLKSFNSDHRGFREVLFYEIMAEIADLNEYLPFHTFLRKNYISLVTNYESIALNAPLLRALKPFIPNYFGIVVHDGSFGQNNRFDKSYKSIPSHIILSDITSEYKKPCVLDLKIGQRTYEPDAPLEKQSSQHNKYPEQHLYGFRIVGMHVYDPNHSDSDHMGYRTFDKKYGIGLKEKNDIRNALALFFKQNTTNGDQVTHQALIGKIMSEIIQLHGIFKELNSGIAFYASSLLIVIEGDADRFAPEKCKIKMIDFAHVRFNSGGDPSYIYGLESLIDILGAIRDMPVS